MDMSMNMQRTDTFCQPSKLQGSAVIAWVDHGRIGQGRAG